MAGKKFDTMKKTDDMVSVGRHGPKAIARGNTQTPTRAKAKDLQGSPPNS